MNKIIKGVTYQVKLKPYKADKELVDLSGSTVIWGIKKYPTSEYPAAGMPVSGTADENGALVTVPVSVTELIETGNYMEEIEVTLNDGVTVKKFQREISVVWEVN